MCYQIITDATADMDWALWDAAVIPMEVMVGRQLRRYGPEGDLSVENFYDALRRGERASTSQITIDTYNCVFEEYLRKGTYILYLFFLGDVRDVPVGLHQRRGIADALPKAEDSLRRYAVRFD